MTLIDVSIVLLMLGLVGWIITRLDVQDHERDRAIAILFVVALLWLLSWAVDLSDVRIR